MRLRNKLLVAVVVVSIVPVAVLGALFQASYREDLIRASTGHLRSVAAVQQSRMTAVLRQNQERLALVSSRTQLRLSLATYLKSADPSALPTMVRILEDAARSIPDLEAITVYSAEGVAVASTDPTANGTRFPDSDLFRRSLLSPVVDRLFLGTDSEIREYISGPMILDGATLGVMLIRSKADNLLSSLFDYAGLGDTGETLLLERRADGEPVSLTPTRFDAGAAMKPIQWPGDLLGVTLEDMQVRKTVEDYRGIPVLSVVRAVPGTNWVLIVKIDQGEALAGEAQAGRRAVVLLFLLLGVSLLVGAVLSRRLSAPLVELASAAREVAGGDYSQRVKVRSNDELGVLEESFNTMSAEVGRAQATLREKVDELNREVSERRLVEMEREKLIVELRATMSEIKRLQGIIPICATCKKIRDDQGSWRQMEAYIRDHSEAEFSHGICPECLQKVEEELERDMAQQERGA